MVGNHLTTVPGCPGTEIDSGVSDGEQEIMHTILSVFGAIKMIFYLLKLHFNAQVLQSCILCTATIMHTVMQY